MTFADKPFGRFRRLHSSDEFEGTGTGFATVRRVNTRHGGRAWANLIPSRFTLLLRFFALSLRR